MKYLSLNVNKITPPPKKNKKNTQMTTLYMNLSVYITFTMIIILDKNNFVKVSHHY